MGTSKQKKKQARNEEALIKSNTSSSTMIMRLKPDIVVLMT
jgi:hypothetical protein